MDNRYNKDLVKQNHDEIYSKLKDLIVELDKEDIDYQLAGALCGYIKYNVESDRCHDDIDININEKDISKFKKVCERMNLTFHDNRLSSPKVLKNGMTVGDHEVLADTTDSDFHIGAFPFERLADGTIITKGYYHDDNNNPCCREEIISSTLAKEFFGREKVDFLGHSLYITSPEYVYILKNSTRADKDLHDIKFLENKIDHNKVERIRNLSKTERVVQHMQVMTLPPTEDVIEKKHEELSDMFDDLEHSEIEKEDNVSKEKPKMLIKKDNSEKGFAGIFSISICILIAITVILIGLIIFTILK